MLGLNPVGPMAITKVGSFDFPVGALIYWFTTNLWTMGQQFWVIRNNPQPGTPAAVAAEERKARKAAKKGLPVEGPSGTVTPVIEGEVMPDQPRPRTQPKRQPRSKRSGPPPKK